MFAFHHSKIQILASAVTRSSSVVSSAQCTHRACVRSTWAAPSGRHSCAHTSGVCIWSGAQSAATFAQSDERESHSRRRTSVVGAGGSGTRRRTRTGTGRRTRHSVNTMLVFRSSAQRRARRTTTESVKCTSAPLSLEY